MAKTEKEKGGMSVSRLQEIAEMRFGTLADDEILALLVERKKLIEFEAEKEQKQKEHSQFEKRKKEILAQIETLNASISPQKEDEELLDLIEERKKLEAELEAIEGSLSGAPEKAKSEVPVPSKEEVSEIPEKQEEIPEEKPLPEEPKETKEQIEEDSSEPKPEKEVPAADFGEESISSDALNGSMQRYVHELEANRESLGNFLQNLPADAKKSREFMLKVAEVDPAYAMHYADQALKKDEEFNVLVAALKNTRNSGNALAEMLPEARTGRVVLAGTKQDYRNVRFVQPTMKEYDEILSIAKKGALEKVDELKEATDVMLLIPKILQKDKAFMTEVEKRTGKKS